MALPLTETDKFLLLSAVGAPETRDRIAALLDLAGTGNMTGPASATNNSVVRFDGTTGALVKNSGVSLDDSNNLSGIALLSATNSNFIGTTDSSSTVTGSVVISGGVGIAKKLYVGNKTTITGPLGDDTLVLSNTSAAGNSFGLNITAGGNSSDYSILIKDRSSVQLFKQTGNGLLTMGSTATSQFHALNGQLRIIRGTSGVPNGNGILSISDVTTDTTNKDISITMYPYTPSTQNEMYLIRASVTSTAGTINYGGGDSAGTAATSHAWYTASAVNTNTGTIRLQIDGDGNVVQGNAALATNATNGFFYLTTMAGSPSGDSTDFTGRLPMVFDTVNNKLWINTSGSTWKGVVLA